MKTKHLLSFYGLFFSLLSLILMTACGPKRPHANVDNETETETEEDEWNVNGGNSDQSIMDGWTFEMMRDEFRLFCDYYHIPLIEGDKCFNSWNLDTLMGDHVHPNEEGYIVAGRYLAAQLRAYI